MRQNADPRIINIYIYLKPERIGFFFEARPLSVMYAFWLLIVTLPQSERRTVNTFEVNLSAGTWREAGEGQPLSLSVALQKAFVLSKSVFCFVFFKTGSTYSGKSTKLSRRERELKRLSFNAASLPMNAQEQCLFVLVALYPFLITSKLKTPNALLAQIQQNNESWVQGTLEYYRWLTGDKLTF